MAEFDWDTIQVTKDPDSKEVSTSFIRVDGATLQPGSPETANCARVKSDSPTDFALDGTSVFVFIQLKKEADSDFSVPWTATKVASTNITLDAASGTVEFKRGELVKAVNIGYSWDNTGETAQIDFVIGQNACAPANYHLMDLNTATIPPEPNPTPDDGDGSGGGGGDTIEPIMPPPDCSVSFDCQAMHNNVPAMDQKIALTYKYDLNNDTLSVFDGNDINAEAGDTQVALGGGSSNHTIWVSSGTDHANEWYPNWSSGNPQDYLLGLRYANETTDRPTCGRQGGLDKFSISDFSRRLHYSKADHWSQSRNGYDNTIKRPGNIMSAMSPGGWTLNNDFWFSFYIGDAVKSVGVPVADQTYAGRGSTLSNALAVPTLSVKPLFFITNNLGGTTYDAASLEATGSFYVFSDRIFYTKALNNGGQEQVSFALPAALNNGSVKGWYTIHLSQQVSLAYEEYLPGDPENPFGVFNYGLEGTHKTFATYFKNGVQLGPSVTVQYSSGYTDVDSRGNVIERLVYGGNVGSTRPVYGRNLAGQFAQEWIDDLNGYTGNPLNDSITAHGAGYMQFPNSTDKPPVLAFCDHTDEGGPNFFSSDAFNYMKNYDPNFVTPDYCARL